ncbi:MAG: hypothetical protein JSV77_00440 [Dehalococcoidales bacterium]|nr:MAG: hypothetical protein JSV77_00440 [Dehalococcoidales bacterium]
MLTSRQYRLSRLKTLNLLNELEAVGSQTVSIYLPSGLAGPDIRELVVSAIPMQNIPAELFAHTTSSATGAVVFWGPSRRLLIQPPFPPMEQFISPVIDIEPLRSTLKSTCTVVLILVRLGTFAIGVCRGEQLVASKTGTGLVHGRHRKGGSSQRRFERHRENQAHVFLERVCWHIRQQLEPHAPDLSYLVYGGARTTIQALKKQCSFLNQFEDRTLPPLLNIRRPRREVLEAAITDIWSSRIIEWTDEE